MSEKYQFPNMLLLLSSERAGVPTAADYLPWNDFGTIKKWCESNQVPLIKYGKGELRKYHAVTLWDIQDALSRISISSQPQRTATSCKPKKKRNVQTQDW